MRIFERDGRRCHYCGRSDRGLLLEIDHVVPRALGGDDGDENLVTACKSCNNKKGAKADWQP